MPPWWSRSSMQVKRAIFATKNVEICGVAQKGSLLKKLNHIGGFCRWSLVEMFLLVGCSEDFLCFFWYIRSVEVISDRFRLFIPVVPQGYRAIYSNGWYLDGLSSTWDHMYVTWQSFFCGAQRVEKHCWWIKVQTYCSKFEFLSFMILDISRCPLKSCEIYRGLWGLGGLTPLRCWILRPTSVRTKHIWCSGVRVACGAKQWMPEPHSSLEG